MKGWTIICLPKENSIELKGDTSEWKSSHMKMEFRRWKSCQDLQRPNCKNRSDIDEYLSDIQADLWGIDNEMRLKIYHDIPLARKSNFVCSVFLGNAASEPIQRF